MKRSRLLVTAGLLTICALVSVSVGTADDGKNKSSSDLQKIKHIVVVYEENHSFDNLYGGWEGVDGVSRAPAAHTTQVSQAGAPFSCLLQNDVNLSSPPLTPTCTDPANGILSAFTNAPFRIDSYIAPSDTTCPNPPGAFAPHGFPKGTGQPGGCTEDLVHRYYQEQYQLHGGAQNRYVTGSDAVGLTMGVYDTKALPIYAYLHGKKAPHYAIADRFFQGAFGGSFFNHQFLIAATAPVWAGAPNDAGPNDLHSVVDANGMPNNYPLYHSPFGTAVKDTQLTASCSPPAGRPLTPAGVTCGDFAVNTSQPFYQPYAPGTAVSRRLPPLTNTTIGDLLSAKGVDWAWYSGGWSNANGDVGGPGWTNGTGPACSDPRANAASVYPNCPDVLFQFHHQPFNYYASLAPGTPARKAHLRDEAEFLAAANASTSSCGLKPVSFIKPIGAENEHPGYTGEHQGSNHLVDLLKAIEGSKCAKDTMVVVTYDEFGGQWDHVSPPGQGGAAGPHDQWGPGTRIPALIVSPLLDEQFGVDHTSHDTSSIMATIEHRFGLPSASPTTRDRTVADLSSVFDARESGDKH